MSASAPSGCSNTVTSLRHHHNIIATHSRKEQARTGKQELDPSPQQWSQKAQLGMLFKTFMENKQAVKDVQTI